MPASTFSLASLSGSVQTAKANEQRAVSQVEFDLFVSLLSSKARSHVPSPASVHHRPWTAADESLELVEGLDPRD
jgi:hypothetical protein